MTHMITFTGLVAAIKPSSTMGTSIICMMGTYTTPTKAITMSTPSPFQKPTRTPVHPTIVVVVTKQAMSMDQAVVTRQFLTATTSTIW